MREHICPSPGYCWEHLRDKVKRLEAQLAEARERVRALELGLKLRTAEHDQDHEELEQVVAREKVLREENERVRVDIGEAKLVIEQQDPDLGREGRARKLLKRLRPILICGGYYNDKHALVLIDEELGGN